MDDDATVNAVLAVARIRAFVYRGQFSAFDAKDPAPGSYPIERYRGFESEHTAARRESSRRNWGLFHRFLTRANTELGYLNDACDVLRDGIEDDDQMRTYEAELRSKRTGTLGP